ncbi:MAG: hypothetical protein ACP5UR_06560 [Chloroflexus sp.]|uniref:hypothetical protein n=1 Tax=Chloroflexus sp. TaxID=1904827 RepID=UPI003D0DAA58
MTAISTVASVLSIIIATQANQIAREANRITQESQLPKLSIRHVFSFWNYGDEYKDPCQSSTGDSQWHIEYATAFDITNLGGKAISLVDIQQDNNGKIETFHPSITASVRFDYFKTIEAFDEWFKSKSSPSIRWIEQSKTKFEFSGPPIKVDPGETKRLLLWVGEQVFIDASLSPQDVHKALYDVDWSASIFFLFADNTVIKDSVRLMHPYQFQPRNINLKPFEPCKP